METHQTCGRNAMSHALSVAALLLLALPAPSGLAEDVRSAPVSDWVRDHVTPSMTLELNYALGLDEGKAQKLELTALPRLEIELPKRTRVEALGRVRADAYDRLEPGQPPQAVRSKANRRAFAGDRVEFELLEAWVEAKWGPAFFVLGKQQVVWGQADGLKVLDVVNPQSFREFVLEDFEDSRIALWSLNAEVSRSNTSFQLLWIPDKTYDDFVEPGSGGVYELSFPRFVPRAPPGVAVDLRRPERPSHFFEDSDAGCRLKTFLGGWDLSLNYLYHYYDIPALYVESAVVDGQPTAIVRPRYERTHLVGGTFSNAFGDLTVRGELAFQDDRFFVASDSDGVVESEELLYVLGLDWYSFEDTLVSLQTFQSVLASSPARMERKQVETQMTLLVERRFLAQTLVARAILLTDPRRGDGLVRGSLRYDWSDSLTIRAGFDVFYGDSEGLFGQFDSNDRVTLGLSYTF